MALGEHGIDRWQFGILAQVRMESFWGYVGQHSDALDFVRYGRMARMDTHDGIYCADMRYRPRGHDVSSS